MNRQTAEKWMSGSTVRETFSYSYNADGQLTSASNPDSAYAYSYDGMGRGTSVDNNGTPNVPHVVLSSQYDANSNRTQLSATIAGTADFQNSYSYDALNRLTQLYQAGQTGGNAVATKGANLTYNLLGQLTTIARTNFFGVGPAPDIATSTFSYDDANRLTEIANTTNGGTAIDAYSSTYDAANRVSTFTTTTDGTATYSYDNTNQLVGASYTTNPGATQPANESYSFDANGNRTNTGYSTGTNNQLTSDGTFNYSYDAEGNRATRTRISNNPANDYKTTYTWDYRNRLTDVEFYNNSNVLTKHVHYIYDVFDHLIGKQVDDTGGGTYNRAEFYVLDGNHVALQFDANGNLTERYINGPSASGVDTVLAEEDVTSLTSPGTVTWPLTDNLGTVRDIVNSSGAVVDHIVDNAFGQVAYESAPTVHHLEGFSGAIFDRDTGMENDLHRWYDPLTGRWPSIDPDGFNAGDPDLYRYVGNSPANYVDPFGLADPEKGHNQIYTKYWPKENDRLWTGGLPNPEDDWYPNTNGGFTYHDSKTGYTLIVKKVMFCSENGVPRTGATVFILNDKGQVTGQLLLTQPPDENGNPAKGSWTLLPAGNPKEGGLGIDFGIINQGGKDGNNQSKIEVSADLGELLGKVSGELKMEINVLDDQGDFNPSIEGGTICVGLSIGGGAKGSSELKKWYINTLDWYNNKFQ